MPEMYPAILKGDRLEWTGEFPGPDLRGRVLAVEVAIIGDVPADDSANADHRRRRATAALERLAARGTFAEIEDPVAWQRESRQDRPLPGRDS
jgi:hypothetical protein